MSICLKIEKAMSIAEKLKILQITCMVFRLPINPYQIDFYKKSNFE